MLWWTVLSCHAVMCRYLYSMARLQLLEHGNVSAMLANASSTCVLMWSSCRGRFARRNCYPCFRWEHAYHVHLHMLLVS